jgi:hypothetical protein
MNTRALELSGRVGSPPDDADQTKPQARWANTKNKRKDASLGHSQLGKSVQTKGPLGTVDYSFTFPKGRTMRHVKLSELVLDFDLYIRDTIDTRIVTRYVKATRAGATLPPLITCKKSRRVVDGFKRYRMHQILESETVPVIEKTYRNDAELLADAIRYNAEHGQPLDKADRARCVILAEKLGLDDAGLAAALVCDPEGVAELRTNKVARAGAVSVPLKGTIRHMAGRKLTKKQAETNRKLQGMSVGFYARQILMVLESGMLDRSDEDGMEQLEALHGKLGELFAMV